MSQAFLEHRNIGSGVTTNQVRAGCYVQFQFLIEKFDTVAFAEVCPAFSRICCLYSQFDLDVQARILIAQEMLLGIDGLHVALVFMLEMNRLRFGNRFRDILSRHCCLTKFLLKC
jgi:hypothetical protein